jgi:hypothetical protein
MLATLVPSFHITRSKFHTATPQFQASQPHHLLHKRPRIIQPLLHRLDRARRKINKPMRRPVIHLHHRLIPTHHPLRAHHDRIIQQRILTPTRKQRSGQLLPPEVRPERRNTRIPALRLRGVREQGADVRLHDVGVDDEVRLVVVRHGQQRRQIETAKVQQQAAEREARRARAQVQRDAAREMRAGGLARGEQERAQGLRVRDQVRGRVVALRMSACVPAGGRGAGDARR